jgi:hypothetical protein
MRIQVTPRSLSQSAGAADSSHRETFRMLM